MPPSAGGCRTCRRTAASPRLGPSRPTAAHSTPTPGSSTSCRRAGRVATTCARSWPASPTRDRSSRCSRCSPATSPARWAASTAGRSRSSPTTRCSRPASSIPRRARKIIRLVTVCDAYQLPVIFLVDVPGFMVGRRVEHDLMLHWGMRMMQALHLCSTPTLTVCIRKAFGLAWQAMNGAGQAALGLYVWPGAEIGFMDPEVGVNVAYGTKLAAIDDPDEREDERQRLAADRGRGDLAVRGGRCAAGGRGDRPGRDPSRAGRGPRDAGQPTPHTPPRPHLGVVAHLLTAGRQGDQRPSRSPHVPPREERGQVRPGRCREC